MPGKPGIFARKTAVKRFEPEEDYFFFSSFFSSFLAAEAAGLAASAFFSSFLGASAAKAPKEKAAAIRAARILFI